MFFTGGWNCLSFYRQGFLLYRSVMMGNNGVTGQRDLTGCTKTMIEKIISGGQTGVDRAALDVALQLGIACGGWCPKGRRAEDGPIPERYPLKETSSPAYPQRTR
jgi:hypothetical protein